MRSWFNPRPCPTFVTCSTPSKQLNLSWASLILHSLEMTGSISIRHSISLLGNKAEARKMAAKIRRFSCSELPSSVVRSLLTLLHWPPASELLLPHTGYTFLQTSFYNHTPNWAGRRVSGRVNALLTIHQTGDTVQLAYPQVKVHFHRNYFLVQQGNQHMCANKST